MRQVGAVFDGESEVEPVQTTNEQFERWVRRAVLQPVDPAPADVDPICELLLGYALLLPRVPKERPELPLRADPHEQPRLGRRGTGVTVGSIVRISQCA